MESQVEDSIEGKEEVAFVRASETVLYVAPLCYGTYSECCDKATGICYCRSKCIANVPLEMRWVKKGLYERREIC